VGRQNLTRTRISNLAGVFDLLWLLLTAGLAWARPRHDLVLENLLLRHQLAVLTRSTRTRPRARLRTWDKLLWVVARRLCTGWRQHLSFVTPDTVVRWHQQGWRLFWRWKSRSRGGRPQLSREVQDLLTTMSRENRLWGTERIRGELLKLGVVVSNRSIRRYRWRGPAGSPSQTWRTFLRNHAHHLWAADLFTVPTLTYKTLYVLVFIAHGRRKLVHVNVTANPTAAWVWRQLLGATPWGHKPRHLLRDRDAVYGRDFRQRAQRIGIDAIATPVRSPRANAVVERVIGTLRRECLDHLIVLDEQHLASVLAEFTRFYNQECPHRTLDLQTPEARPRPVTGPIRSRPMLNGLHYAYERAA
jgi:transposase InsO family protein